MSVPSSPAEPSSFRPEAGWYQDPSGHPQMRWWDGRRWTNGVAPLSAYAAPPAEPESTSEPTQSTPLGGSGESYLPSGQPHPAGTSGTVPPPHQMQPAVSSFTDWFKPIDGWKRDKKWWLAIIGGGVLFLLSKIIEHMGTYSTPYGTLDVAQVHALWVIPGALCGPVLWVIPGSLET
jgi:hypothetical protein